MCVYMCRYVYVYVCDSFVSLSLSIETWNGDCAYLYQVAVCCVDDNDNNNGILYTGSLMSNGGARQSQPTKKPSTLLLGVDYYKRKCSITVTPIPISNNVYENVARGTDHRIRLPMTAAAAAMG